MRWPPAKAWFRFWAGGRHRTPYAALQSYPRSWARTVVLLAAASLIPMTAIALVDYRVTRQKAEHEHSLETLRLASNARRAISYFIEERLDALHFIVREVSPETLSEPEGLAEVLANLNHGFGGFTDLGFIDDDGRQVAYVGPHDLIGQDYGTQEWFTECAKTGAFVSDVYRGFRDEPHLAIAARSAPSDGSFFVLRATVDTQRLFRTLSPYAPATQGDVFLVNRAGIIQTPPRRYGEVLGASWVEAPPLSTSTQTLDAVDPEGTPVSVGYAYISTRVVGTPFVLILVNDKTETIESLARYRRSRVFLVAANIGIVLLVVVLTSAFLFNRLFDADMEKAHTLQRIEENSRLASIGRLAAGVAHEINNPLAIIKETAGYMKDVGTAEGDAQSKGDHLMHLDSILESVDRCGTITRQLLGFAREPSVHVKAVRTEDLIRNVLSFQLKEAEYKGISIHMQVEEGLPEIITDRSKLEQVLLNLVRNAFQAMDDGGELSLSVRRNGGDGIKIGVRDTGCGIPEKDLSKLFEPFFTTKEEGHGTGLGLFITYGLVSRLGGDIQVESEVGRGTVFSVLLPLSWGEEKANENPVG